jgi:uncharacterized membrane protein YbhN (UPF0104 family)
MTGRRAAIRGGQVLVSLGILAYLISTIPMRDVGSALLGASPFWLGAGFAFTAVNNVLAALQMRAILATLGMTFSLRQVTGINLITNFYGLFLPSYLIGGVIRWYHFSAPEGKRAQALAAMIFSRGVELVTTIGYGIVFWYLAASPATSISVVLSLMLSMAAAILVVGLSVSPAPHAALRAMLSRLLPAQHIRERIFKVSLSLVDFGRRGRRHQLLLLLLCIVRNAFGIVAFVCFARSLHIEVHALDLGWVRAVLDLVLILPISFAGLGVRDASLVAMLQYLGVTAAVALAFSFVLLARTLVVALVGGVIEGLRVAYGIAPGLVITQREQVSKGP